MTDVVEIIRDLTPQIVEIIQDLQPTIVEVAARGPQGPAGPAGSAGPEGPAGPAGPNTIGGYGFSIDGELDGDVLGFNGASWYNRRQETLSDGGNF